MNHHGVGVLAAALLMLLQNSCASIEVSKTKRGYVSTQLLQNLQQGMSRDHCKLVLGDPESVARGDKVTMPLGRRASSIRTLESWTYNIIADLPQLRAQNAGPRIGMPPRETPVGGSRKVKLLFVNDMLEGLNVENTSASSPDAIGVR